MRKPRGFWPWFWGALLAVGLIGELIAVGDPRGGDTLTEQVQYIGGFFPVAFVIGVVGLLVWLGIHFLGRNSRIWRWREERDDD